MSEPQVTVQITETINYAYTLPLSELRAILGESAADMTPEEVARTVVGNDEVEERLQNYGEVEGARWSVFVDGAAVVTERTPMAFVVDDGEASHAQVVYSMDEVYRSLRDNYALGEDVADEDLVEYVQSQGVLVYIQ